MHILPCTLACGPVLAALVDVLVSRCALQSEAVVPVSVVAEVVALLFLADPVSVHVCVQCVINQ